LKTARKYSRDILVHPCIIDGEKTLVYQGVMLQQHPETLAKLEEYARSNGFKLKEDRRSGFNKGVERVKDKRKSNLMILLLLTASLSTQSTIAAVNSLTAETNLVGSAEQVQEDTSYIDLDGEVNDIQSLMLGLLEWINHRMSSSFNLADLPGVKMVSEAELANIAFGGTLPGSLNAVTMQIFGLYNFHDNIVYLLDSVDLNTEAGKGILLHELVHFMQYQNVENQKVENLSELESLAYFLETRYLHEQTHAEVPDTGQMAGLNQPQTR